MTPISLCIRPIKLRYVAPKLPGGKIKDRRTKRNRTRSQQRRNALKD